MDAPWGLSVMAVLSWTRRLNGSRFIMQSNLVPNLTIHIESTPNKYLLSECHSEKSPNTSVWWFLANYFLYHFIKSLRSQAGLWLTYMGDMDVASFLVFMSLLILSWENYLRFLSSAFRIGDWLWAVFLDKSLLPFLISRLLFCSIVVMVSCEYAQDLG